MISPLICFQYYYYYTPLAAYWSVLATVALAGYTSTMHTAILFAVAYNASRTQDGLSRKAKWQTGALTKVWAGNAQDCLL